MQCGSHNSTALKPEDENEKLSADDVPEELQLRDSSKKGDLTASAGASSSAPTSSTSSSTANSSNAPAPLATDHSTPVAQRQANQDEGDLSHLPAVLEPEFGDLPADLPLNAPRETPLYQPPPLGTPVGQNPEANIQSVRAILRDQLDNVLSIIVLLISLLVIYKLFMYL